MAALFSGGCLLDSGSAPGQQVVPATSVVIPTLTARPVATPTPRPTPTPVTVLGRNGAEALVWNLVRPCANQIAVSSATEVAVEFSSTYTVDTGTWLVEASMQDSSLSFGRWSVSDGAGEVTPVDPVAVAMASDGVICARPNALLAVGATSPLFPTVTPIPTPTPVPTPTPTPTPTAVPTAVPPSPTPLPTPAAKTGEQARLRVWVAIRACFDPLPLLEDFIAHQDRPERWIVVGTGKGGVNYGLWFVDAAAGSITPQDSTARTTQGNSTCFFVP